MTATGSVPLAGPWPPVGVAGGGFCGGGGGEDCAADPQPTDASQIHSTEETVRKDRITDSLAPAPASLPRVRFLPHQTPEETDLPPFYADRADSFALAGAPSCLCARAY